MRMSGIVSSIAFESDLNGIVREYLSLCGYPKTCSTFERECLERGKSITSSESSSRHHAAVKGVQMEMLSGLRQGRREEFFALWEKNLSEKIRNSDPIAQKLEFYLHIYFAIYPINHSPNNVRECEDAMKNFRLFIETRGASLSQTTEFLPFYALPYVPDPRAHPSYRELFAPHWVPDLELRLTRFLDLAMESSTQPQLFDLYSNAGRLRQSGGGDLGAREVMQLNVVEAENRTMQYMKLYHKSQSNYFNLIGITADLVDALEKSVQGVPVTPESVQEILARLFMSQGQSGMDLSRPGTAAKALRQSIMPSARDEPSKMAPKPAPVNPAPAPPPAVSQNLNFQKVKSDIQGNDFKKSCAILQALRWRLTRSNDEMLKTNLTTYLSNDLLGIAGGKPNVLDCLDSSDALVREYVARLLNAFASLYSGRSYLIQNGDAIDAMVECLKKNPDQPHLRDQLMGALQKLSLRAFCQKRLINDHNMVQWLIDLLEDHDNLSEYGLEYSSALCMNLCLRPSGRRMCTPIAQKSLKVLSDLLGHEQKEIVPYVNGTLYSILGVPEIREQARAMDMEGILKCFIREDEPHTNRQIEYIIRQLHSSDGEDAAAADSEPDEDEDEEEDDPDIELGPDKDESFCDFEPAGEALLGGQYAGRPATAARLGSRQGSSLTAAAQAADELLTRPVTPGQQRPPTRSGSKPATPSATGTRKGSGTHTAGSSRDYAHGFASRPLVARTPDPGAGASAAPPSTPPKPQYSGGLPTSSRPNSATRPTSGGRRSSRGNAGGASGQGPQTPRKANGAGAKPAATIEE